MKIRFAIAVLLFAGLISVNSADGQDAISRYRAILDANTLTREGGTPFHIKLSFQLYDIEGKPSDTGEVEEWWAAPGQSKILVQAASLKMTAPTEFDKALVIDPRERYFIQRLLTAELHPVPPLKPADQAKLQVAKRTFGSTALDCLSIPPDNANGSARNPANFCVDPESNALRVDFEQRVSTTTRNGVSTFHGTTVSASTETAFEKRPAIAGKVTLLEAFDPSTSAVQLPAPVSKDPANSNSVATPAKIKLKIAPLYPSYGISAQESATVVLQVVITKQGTISEVVPLASPNVLFTQSAVNAVKQWKYEPFLLNGQPVDLTTDITVNFNFGGRR